MERTVVLLAPGKSMSFEYVLDGKSLPEGDYGVSVDYYAHKLIPGADQPLRSNSVLLMIRK